MPPTLIFCGGNNKAFYEIATAAGYLYGVQLPSTAYGPLYFADQNWKNPNREIYINALSVHRPYMASVLDWEREEQLPEVLGWAEDAAQFVEVVMIIPKVQNGVNRIPRVIGDKPVRLGYSVPTKHGGTELGIWEFIGWPVHLLGGSPGQQMKLSKYMDVKSADGNMAMKMANSRCLYWERGKGAYSNSWNSIKEDGVRFAGDGTEEAFSRSCKNIIKAWRD